MFTFDEIRNNLSGAWLIMKGDPDGLGQLDTTIEGFWRSFGALLLIIPVFVLGLLADSQLASDSTEFADSMLPVPLQVILIFLEWTLFPAMMALACRPLGLSGQYVPFIVARNWASVLTSGFYIPLLLFYLLGLLPVALLLFISFGLLVLIGFFSFRIARTALLAPPGLAAGVVAAEFGLSFLLRGLAEMLIN